MAAPTHWVPLPVGFPTAPKMLALLDEFGAPGPYVFIVLLATAGTQRYTGGEGGHVRIAWRELARLAAIEVDAARVIVRRIAELGEIETSGDDLSVHARFVQWEDWDRAPKDPTAAERKRKQRAKSSGRDSA